VPNYQLFVIRAIIGIVVAVVLSRFFFSDTNLFYIAGLAVILVGLAYFSEYLRNRRSR